MSCLGNITIHDFCFLSHYASKSISKRAEKKKELKNEKVTKCISSRSPPQVDLSLTRLGIWGSSCKPNQLCQIFWQSIPGFHSAGGVKF